MSLRFFFSVRDSFDALQALCAAAVRTESGVVANGGVSADVDDGRWLAALHESRWLTLIAMILKGAMRVASLLRDGNPVLIHCRFSCFYPFAFFFF
jgi:hypothetical protein